MSEEYGKFLKGEVERFHHEKVQDFSQALNDFVQIQVASGSKVQEYWQSCFSGSRAATEPPKPRDLAVEDMAEDIQDMQG
mmetsp:Transcript_39852/g.93522  ORF Transcript_39852/g.93522 Transcript_39852/m.93522 type:complete len:80 (+) Transcript_39852:114-353(+)